MSCKSCGMSFGMHYNSGKKSASFGSNCYNKASFGTQCNKKASFGTCPYCSQKPMEFGVKPKASTVKGLSSVKKSDLIEFATKNGVMVDEKLTKDKLFGLIKRQADEVSRMLEEKTGKKYTRLTAADITENLKTRSLYVPVEVTKVVKVEPVKPDISKMMRIDIQEKEIKKGRMPAGSKKVRGEKVKVETMDELADLFAGIKPSYKYESRPLKTDSMETLIDGMSSAALFGSYRKSKFGA